ncbi:MAG TPA: TonB-dependent receptor [Sphingomonadaceae bacterium]|nr:TonB-dependent receptor [Sphingomonadaceae bacterium]
MGKRNRRRMTMPCWMMATSLAALGWASAAAAQTADDAGNSGGVEDIVVTAQFRAQNLQDTPIAITAVNSDMLEARSQTNIAEVANQAPSVTLKSQSAAFGPSLGANIRGIGQFDPSPAVEPGVGLYVDDVYYATLTGSVLDLLDLDRVEILRGPQGTLAGRNSIGGAIKLYSKKPTGESSGFLQATYGSRDRLDLRGSANFALTDSLFGRISGVAKKQDGYVKRLDYGCVNPAGSARNPAVGGVARELPASSNCVFGRDGGVDTQALRGQLRFDDGGPIEINLIADYTSDKRTSAGEVLTYSNTQQPWARTTAPAVDPANFICGKFCNYSNAFSPAGTWTGPVAPGYPLVESRYRPHVDFQGWGVSGQINWKPSDRLEIVSITAYRQYHSRSAADLDLSPLPIDQQSADIRFWSFSQEVRVNGSLGANNLVEYTIGGFYLDQRTINGLEADFRYTPFPLQFEQDDPVNADTKAAFGQIILNATDKLKLIGGLRYTEEHKDYLFRRINRDGTLNPFLNPAGNPIDGRTGIYNGNRVDYRASLQYQFTPGVMGYGQVATGFKGGGVNPRPFTAFQVVPFSPETVTSYEVGLKTDLFDRRARINVAAFYSDYKGVQLNLVPTCPGFSDPTTTDDDAGPCSAIANAGDAHIKGIEVETSLRPIPGLAIDGAVSYVDFKYTRINPAAGGPSNPAGPQLDDVTPYTPKWKWSIGVQYEIGLGDGGSLTPRFDASYQSTIYSNPTNSPFERIDGYTLANARLTWRNAEGDLEISGEVTNLFDKYYYLTAFDNSGSAGFATAQPGRPREWALSLKKKF